MNVNYQPASLYIHSELESKLDSTFVQVVECLRRESDTLLDLLVLFESMKFQVLDLAATRFPDKFVIASRKASYQQQLHTLENRLLLAKDKSADAQCAMLLLLAMAYYRQQDLNSAKDFAERARHTALLAGREDGLGFNDLLIAICSLELGQWETAADRCILALNEIAHHENKSTLAQVWHIYGYALSKLGRHDEAAASMVMSQNLYGQQRTYNRQVQVLLNLAQLFKTTGDWHGVVYYLKQALVMCYHHSFRGSELEVLNLLSEAYHNLGRITEAAGCSQRIRQLQADPA